MSTFWIKVIAVLAMTADHIGFVVGDLGGARLTLVSFILRAIGRISFPLFAFCLAQGWQHTHDRKRYFENLTLGAVISQIPFTIAFQALDEKGMSPMDTFVSFWWLYLLFGAVAVWSYWHLGLHRNYDHSLILVAIAAIVPGLQVNVDGIWIFSESTNIFYTFLVAFFCLYLLENRNTFQLWERSALLFAVPILLLGYGLPADYGTCLFGVVLIVGFVLVASKDGQAFFLTFWSFLYYGILIGKWDSALFCSFAALCILLHDERMNSKVSHKRFFYWFYPIHLLILGLIRVGLS